MAKSNRESDYVIQAAKKRGADPMGFETTRDERFAISPEKIAHDVIGDPFFTMTETQRQYIVELVRSGDLTSSEISEAANVFRIRLRRKRNPTKSKGNICGTYGNGS